MAEINVNEAYDLAMFEPRRAKPQPGVPAKKPLPEPQRVKEKQHTAAQIKHEAANLRRRVTKIMVVCMLLAAMAGANLHSRVQIIELNAQHAEKTAQLEAAKSENVRLNMAVNAKVSLDKVEAYALLAGMQKMERYQMYFINTDNDNRVLYYNSRTIGKNSGDNP